MNAQTAPANQGLDAHLKVDRDRFNLDINIGLAAGQVLALLGPNGAGKSTALRALAGLVPLDDGHVRLAGTTLDDTRTRTSTPTNRRRVGMVFQEYLLFPHLSATENVAFGLRARGIAHRQAQVHAHEWLDRMGLTSVAKAKPSQLSGGQAQRVALARAMATDPALLLLDEPLAALDASIRPEIRSDLRRHLNDYTGCSIIVTHDPLDAMVLADQLIVIENGTIVQQGRPVDVARAPRTQYVASLVGLNLYQGQANNTTVTLVDDATLTTAEAHQGTVFVAFPPSAVALHRDRPNSSARNTWKGTIAGMEQHGDVIRVRLDARPSVLADITTAAVADLDLAIGTEVWASVKATEIRTYLG